MKVSVKVPATSANIGPGFDCLGMALPIYNVVTIDETVLPGTGVEINILSDEENTYDHELDYEIDNCFYLKDFKKKNTLIIFLKMRIVSYIKQLNFCIIQLDKHRLN